MLRELSLPRLINENGSSLICVESLSMMCLVYVSTFPFASLITIRHGYFWISMLP